MGVTFSELLNDLDSRKPLVARSNATNAIQSIGTNALPILLRLIYAQNRKELFAPSLYADPKFFTGDVSKEYSVLARQEKVIIAFAILGAKAKIAVGALIQALESEDTVAQQAAATALGSIGPEARQSIPALVGTLASKFAGVRRSVAYALGELGENADTVIPILAQLLRNDSQSSVRASAASALGKFGKFAGPAFPDLMHALEDPNGVGGKAAFSLAKIAKALPKDSQNETVNALIGKLRNASDWPVRSFAALALGEIGPEASFAVPALTEAINDPNEAVARSAAEALRKINNKSP